jgi:hypothetical protein
LNIEFLEIPNNVLNNNPNELTANNPKITEGIPDNVWNKIITFLLQRLCKRYFVKIATLIPIGTLTNIAIVEVIIVPANGTQNEYSLKSPLNNIPQP